MLLCCHQWPTTHIKFLVLIFNRVKQTEYDVLSSNRFTKSKTLLFLIHILKNILLTSVYFITKYLYITVLLWCILSPCAYILLFYFGVFYHYVPTYYCFTLVYFITMCLHITVLLWCILSPCAYILLFYCNYRRLHQRAFLIIQQEAAL